MDDLSTADTKANPSGAPTAGGATSLGSRFGGASLTAHVLRFVARVARDLESVAYRRLRELERRTQAEHPSVHPGAPQRAKQGAA
jgi:hypothetical protein